MRRAGVLMAIWLVIGCWLVISMAALFGMYRLWWQRERVLYVGKSVEQQREIVLQRAGLPVAIAAKTGRLLHEWPPEAHYLANGDYNTLSYIKYMLIPRVPSGDDRYSLRVEGNNLLYSHGTSQRNKVKGEQYPPTPAGLILSLLLVSGLGVIVRYVLRFKLSWPEAVALACCSVTVFAYFSRLLSSSVLFAFYGITLVGIVGWCLVFIKCYKDKNGLKDRLIRCGQRLHGRWSGEYRWPLRVFIIFLVGIIALNVFWSFIMSVVVVPDDWDAWAMWGAKAKMLALGHGPLLDVTYFGHSDYPLLWPVIWAFSGWCAGGWEEQWSRGWGAVFLFFSLWELYVIVYRQTRHRIVAMLSGALFVSVPMVPLLASWSYAEAPLWLMMLCALACFFRWQEQSGKVDIITAGVFAAGAAWTKNEGMLFACLLACCFLLARPRSLATVFLFLGVVIACYLPWLIWSRVVHALGVRALVGLGLSYAILLRAASRLDAALEAIKNMWFDVRQWSIVGWALGISCLCLFVSPATKNRALLLIPAGMLFAFLIIMVFHTDEIYWQVGTSWNRLTVQSLPLFFVVVIPELWRKYREIR